VFVRVEPAAAGFTRTTIVIVAVLTGSRRENGTEHVTAEEPAAPLQVPRVGETNTNVTLAGSESITVYCAASSPWLVSVRV
jgi:hypothetical protein